MKEKGSCKGCPYRLHCYYEVGFKPEAILEAPCGDAIGFIAPDGFWVAGWDKVEYAYETGSPIDGTRHTVMGAQRWPFSCPGGQWNAVIAGTVCSWSYRTGMIREGSPRSAGYARNAGHGWTYGLGRRRRGADGRPL